MRIDPDAGAAAKIPGDLMGMIARASQNGTTLPSKPEWAKRGLQPVFTGAGFLVSQALKCIPSSAAFSIQDRVFQALAKDYRTSFEDLRQPLERARQAVRRAEQDAGKPAALLALLSHPPAYGDAAALNVEMVRQAVLALRFLRQTPCRPRLVIAVDDFALDMLALYEEGLYAGFVAGAHLGVYRTALRRDFGKSSLLRRTALDLFPWRLFSRLESGGEVGMVLSGGVPATGRALYALREWVKDVWRRREAPRGAAALQTLRENEDFRRFEAELPLRSPLRRNVPFLCAGWAAARALGLGVNSGVLNACAAGRLDAPTAAALGAAARAAGLGEEEVRARIAALAAEFSRETPFRRRFFRLLAGRVLGRAGRPVVFVPIAHGRADGAHLGCGDCWVWRSQDGGRISAVKAGTSEEAWSGTADEFAVRFVSENFE
ncbi:MAG: hypothetical protein KGL04_03380 [Elusimicrobia bacterium]|nr:hypothetical protein [Elusimicrobiota bacterium]